MYSSKYFLITIDVEDWFQVENFKPWIPFSTWDSRELRVEQNVHRLLDLFDKIKLPAREEKLKKSCESCQKYESKKNPFRYQNDNLQLTTINQRHRQVKATFFVLGWIAERLPHLVREIATRGHEVASHGCNHHLPNRMSGQDLRWDLVDSRKKLEDTIGSSIVGFRAPSFSINENVLNTVGETGYIYDSSFNSFALHGRYGKITLNGQPMAGIAHKLSTNFYELPVSNLKLKFATNNNLKTTNTRQSLSFVLPFGGGAYFRLLPLNIFIKGVRWLLKKETAFLLYLHPWEVDPEQPRVNQASYSSKLRHYTNLHNTETKLKKLIESFDYCQFLTCSEYLNTISTLGT